MGVFTQLSREDARAVAAAYGLGGVREARGIPAGSVNSNYAFECDSGLFFLLRYMPLVLFRNRPSHVYNLLRKIREGAIHISRPNSKRFVVVHYCLQLPHYCLMLPKQCQIIL